MQGTNRKNETIKVEKRLMIDDDRGGVVGDFGAKILISEKRRPVRETTL